MKTNMPMIATPRSERKAGSMVMAGRTFHPWLSTTLKRLVDVVISAIGLLLLAPLFAVVAIALRFDSPGPIFYHARRVGKGGREFGMYKFRTMVERPVDDGPKVTAWDDPRITRTGRILRDTKLNELPQLLNVLKGEMSLVGPRPEAPEFVAHYSAEEREVLQATPGITSLAAVIYSAEESLLSYANASESYIRDIMPTKLRLDLLYVRQRSLLLDLDIILRTLVAILPRIGRSAPDAEAMLLGPVQRLARRHLSWFSLDVMAAFAAVALAGLLWRAIGPIDLGWGTALLCGVGLAMIFSVVNYVTGVQATMWRSAGAHEMLDVVLSATVATVLLLAGNALPVPKPTFPPGLLVLTGVFAMAGFIGVRYRGRLVRVIARRMPRLRSSGAGKEQVIVIGSGSAGRLVTSLLRSAPAAGMFHIVGMVDDDLQKRGSRINGMRVLGSRSHIPRLVEQHDIGLIVLAIHNIEAAEKEQILQLCRSTQARVVVMPDLATALFGSPSAANTLEASAELVSSPVAHLPASGDQESMVQATTVSGWMDELHRLASEGHVDALQQRLYDIQMSLEKTGTVGMLPPAWNSGTPHTQAVATRVTA